MAKFIEVHDRAYKRTVLVNVEYIFEVEKEYNTGFAILKIAANGHNNSPYRQVQTDMDYMEVRKMIDDSMAL